MNIETYTLDSLRKLVRDLQEENKELRNLLDKAGIPCTESEVFSDPPDKAEEYDPDQGARMYLPNGLKMEVITRSVTTVGKRVAPNKGVRSNIVRIVLTGAGRN